MLERLDNLNENILNIVIYAPSEHMQVYLKNRIKETFKLDSNFIRDVVKTKEFEAAKLDSFVSPLYGGKWCIHVNTEKVDKKDILKGLNKNTDFALTVYWVDNYGLYKFITTSDNYTKQSAFALDLYMGKLTYTDIKRLLTELVPLEYRLNSDLMHYVCDTYKYDVQAVFELINLLKSGNEFKDKKEIIDSIGIGGNSVDNLVLSLLRTQPKTESGRRTSLKKNLALLNDLSYSYKYSTIRNFMLNMLDGCIELKQLQIMGYYRKYEQDIPESFDSKRLNRIKRYANYILHEVTLPELLNLKTCIAMYNTFDAEVDLMRGMLKYIGTKEGKVVEFTRGKKGK